jgi:hypothetical protein
MRQPQEKKIEVLINNKRFTLSEKAAKIAINSYGATEIIPLQPPQEVLKKTVPRIIEPTADPIEVKSIEIKAKGRPKSKK